MHVVATAGHVDHGKSTLVRALTGMEPDRWAEEHRRGLTIDLGFAWTSLPRSGAVSFVDVPGHQRFIANMLAGLGPAPVVLFVVAADAGWSAQSVEHLAAIDALGIAHGLLAVTRSDLADPGPALDQARARIAATALGEVPAVAVSGATGAGLPALRDALDGVLARTPRPDTGGRLRLWIDRSFTVRGAGTVVTGTLGSGSVTVGDALEVAGRRVRVRGVQTNGDARGAVGATARVALNLRGVERGDVTRGDALLTPDAWHLTDTVDVALRADDTLPRELVLHVGTAAVPVRVRPLGGAFARLHLTAPLPLAPGDRAVLRDPGRRTVAAGAEVLDVDPPDLSRRGAAAERAGALAAAPGPPGAHEHVQGRGVVSRTRLARMGVAVDIADGDPLVHRVGDLLVDADAWRVWIADLQSVVTAWPARDPLQPSPTPAAARDAIGLPGEPGLLSALVTAAGLHIVDGRLVHTDAPAPAGLPPGVAAVRERLDADPFAAPTQDDLAELGLRRRELAAATRAGALLVLAGDIVLLPDAPTRAVGVLAGLDQPFTASAARQALGSTRRVVLPLLEHLDATGRTERVDGTARRVRSAPHA
jgi:selenocysteine-specific elongation factor